MNETSYISKCKTRSDINEHLPTLKKYADKCNTVVEMGVRDVVSTWAFVESSCASILSIDLYHPSSFGGSLQEVEEVCKEKNKTFTFLQADTLQIEIDSCDLLFIDTLHTFKHLQAELQKHGNKAQKYLIFHDTTTFGHIDEHDTNGIGLIAGITHEKSNTSVLYFHDNPDRKGLIPAIKSFLQNNPHWVILEEYHNNNGLSIFRRKDALP